MKTSRDRTTPARPLMQNRITRYTCAAGDAMKRAVLAGVVASIAAGCCCTKAPPPTPPPATGPICPNESIDPTCTTLVMAAFCQARARPVYGNCELYPVSRGFEIAPADKGKRLRDMKVSLDAPGTQTCQQACEKLGEALEGSGTGWQSVVYDDGHALGVADIGALFFGDSAGHLMTVGGRPDSGYLQQDTPYADWCCCARGCGIPAPVQAPAAPQKGRGKR